MQMDINDVFGAIITQTRMLANQCEDIQRTMNIIGRVLVENGILTEEKITNSLKKEYEVLKELGGVDDIPSDENIKSMVNNLMSTLSGDIDKVKDMIKRHEEEIKKHMEKRKIETVDASVLGALDKAASGGNKKLIL